MYQESAFFCMEILRSSQQAWSSHGAYETLYEVMNNMKRAMKDYHDDIAKDPLDLSTCYPRTSLRIQGALPKDTWCTELSMHVTVYIIIILSPRCTYTNSCSA